MIKGLLEKLPLTTILIAYFFICGGLYLIGFWTTFGIDISPFISLTDIPKSFVLPFVLSQGLYLFHLFTNFFATSIQQDEELHMFPEWRKKKWFRIFLRLIHPDMLFVVVTFFILRFYTTHQTNALFWYFSSFGVGLYLIFKFVTFKEIKDRIPYFILRLYLGYIVCLLPIFCFSTGKILAVDTYNNKDIKYITISNDTNQSEKADSTFSNQSNQSLKFLGFLGDKLIASSLDNEKIVFLNQSSADKVVLSKKPPTQTVDSTIHTTPTKIDSTTTQTNDTTVRK